MIVYINFNIWCFFHSLYFVFFLYFNKICSFSTWLCLYVFPNYDCVTLSLLAFATIFYCNMNYCTYLSCVGRKYVCRTLYMILHFIDSHILFPFIILCQFFFYFFFCPFIQYCWIMIILTNRFILYKINLNDIRIDFTDNIFCGLWNQLDANCILNKNWFSLRKYLFCKHRHLVWDLNDILLNFIINEWKQNHTYVRCKCQHRIWLTQIGLACSQMCSFSLLFYFSFISFLL